MTRASHDITKDWGLAGSSISGHHLGSCDHHTPEGKNGKVDGSKDLVRGSAGPGFEVEG